MKNEIRALSGPSTLNWQLNQRTCGSSVGQPWRRIGGRSNDERWSVTEQCRYFRVLAARFRPSPGIWIASSKWNVPRCSCTNATFANTIPLAMYQLCDVKVVSHLYLSSYSCLRAARFSLFFFFGCSTTLFIAPAIASHTLSSVPDPLFLARRWRWR